MPMGSGRPRIFILRGRTQTGSWILWANLGFHVSFEGGPEIFVWVLEDPIFHASLEADPSPGATTPIPIYVGTPMPMGSST